MFDPCTLAMIGRSLALRGELVALLADDGMVPASDWDVRTRNSRPSAYRLSIPEAEMVLHALGFGIAQVREQQRRAAEERQRLARAVAETEVHRR